MRPDEVTALLHEHDLLVHPSRLETFGMTVVEAIATGTPVLVARSQGPSETLAGLERRAGLLIEPSLDPDVIAAGFRTLRSRLDTLDLPAARAELSARYGFAAVAAQLPAAYGLTDPPRSGDRHPDRRGDSDAQVEVVGDARGEGGPGCGGRHPLATRRTDAGLRRPAH